MTALAVTVPAMGASAAVLASELPVQQTSPQTEGIKTGLYTEPVPDELNSLVRKELMSYIGTFYDGPNREEADSFVVLGNGVTAYRLEDGTFSKGNVEVIYFPVYANGKVLFVLNAYDAAAPGLASDWRVSAIQGDCGWNDILGKEGKFILASHEYGRLSMVSAPDDAPPFSSSVLVSAGIENRGTSCAAWRLYNPYSGEHLYTVLRDEKDVLTQKGWKAEAIGWFSPTRGLSVYRMYNPNSGEHHYTISEKEKNELSRVGWKSEGAAFYGRQSESGIPVYRLYNPKADNAASHHYTTSKVEAERLQKDGWKDEGIGWYVDYMGI